MPYVANYASSYDAHTINHDIRVPVAPVAPIIKATPLAAAIPQVLGAYSPVASLTSVIPQNLAPAIAAYSVAPVATSLPLAAALPAIAPSPAVSRSSEDAVSEDIKSDSPAPQQNQRNQVPVAVRLASQFLAKNTAMQQDGPASLRTAPQDSRQTAQLGDNQKSNGVLGTSPTGSGFVQRTNARFAQFPQSDQAKANLQSSQRRQTQNNPQNAKLVRQNEDSESVVVENPSSQAYGPENVPANNPAVPARLAALAPSINLLPNVYTSVITF